MNPSGASEQDIMIQAKMLLAQDKSYKKGFRFDHVWPILKDIEKFIDNVNAAETHKMTTNNLSLRSIIEKENRLDSFNFKDWYKNLWIVLKSEKKLYVFNEHVQEAPILKATQEEIDTYAKYLGDDNNVQCLILASMKPNLQEQDEHLDTQSIMTHLKELFLKCARHDHYDASKALFRCRMVEGFQLGLYVLKMIGYIQKLETLGFVMDVELSVDLVL
ncbi:uncharacterized protein LOC116131648 [Pistacia vera]|uniref:uncharacterized protein LOC116131648 n=1 Tax=Pistacia vera TaxID=55513 RepID=UPI0012636845|nr:uncharacterized protein LOC116131648 [Pistacia vera]